MFCIREISDKDLKTSITLKIMNSLPKWFSPPEDIAKNLFYIGKCPFLLPLTKAIMPLGSLP